MKLKIRYENTVQTLEVGLEEMWVMLSLTGEEGMSGEEREKAVQKAMDESFNRPEYNNWRKFNMHRDEKARPKRLDRKAGYVMIDDRGEGAGTEVIEDFPDPDWEKPFAEPAEYEDVSDRLRDALPERQAELLLRIHVDGCRACDIAAAEGVSASAVSHRLERAEKRFKKVFPEPSTFGPSRCQENEDV